MYLALPGFLRTRAAAVGLLATGVVCPCHALVGVVALVTGGAILTPAEQDGVHAVYVPFAVLAGALLLRVKSTNVRRSIWRRDGEQ